MAKSKPDKNKPWYHVLVHGQGNETYVAESNLTTDDNIDPVDHPFVDIFFYEYDNSGQYSLKQTGVLIKFETFKEIFPMLPDDHKRK